MSATVATTSWQDTIAHRLAERDARDKAHDQIIADCELLQGRKGKDDDSDLPSFCNTDQQLAKHARTLQHRNQSLLQAAGVVQGSSSATTGQQAAVGPRHSTGTVTKGGQDGSANQPE